MKQLNVGRWVCASLAVYAAQMALGLVIHAGILARKGFYSNPLWRPEEAWRLQHQLSFHASLLIFAFAFVWIFHYGWSGKKWEGLRYGIYMCFLYTIPMNLLWYALQPVGEVAAWWMALETPAMVIFGLVAGAIYKPKES